VRAHDLLDRGHQVRALAPPLDVDVQQCEAERHVEVDGGVGEHPQHLRGHLEQGRARHRGGRVHVAAARDVAGHHDLLDHEQGELDEHVDRVAEQEADEHDHEHLEPLASNARWGL
jgi:hypothetical protein